jgi:cobalt-zinc-cadmium efflux system membrane fusion protein
VLVTLPFVAGCGKGKPPAPDEELVTLNGDTITFHRPASGAPREEEKYLTLARVTKVRPQVKRYPGRVVWNEDRTVRISSPFAGRVVRIQAQIGDRVAAGTPLLTLTSPDIGSAQSDAAKADADLLLAEKAATRARDLQSAGIVAAREMEQAEADLAHARAERARALRRLEPYGVAAVVDGQFIVRSPIAGVVVERAANPGQEIRPDQAAALFVISDPESLWLQLDLPEESAALTRVGQEITVHRATGALSRVARVVSVPDAVDPLTRTLRTRAVLGNPDRALKAEQFVAVDVTATGEPTPVVPASAVFLVGDRQFAWVSDGPGVYKRRTVTTDGEANGEVAISAGLGANDVVVTRGAIYLQQLAANAAGS